MTDKKRMILLTITHFNNTKEVECFLRHISDFKLPYNWHIEIAITDNSNNLKLPDKFTPNIKVYMPLENIGYLKGCSFAFNKWIEESKFYPEWVVITNTDIKFDEKFFNNLVNLILPEEVCCIAPDVLLENGYRQNAHKKCRPGDFEMYAYTLIYRNTFLTFILDNLYYYSCNLRRKLKDKKIKLPSNFELIYAPHGSCFLLKKTFFEKGGNLNYKGFMYGEEIYIAEEIRKLNLDVAWVPELKVTHFKKSTTCKVLNEKKVRWRLEISKILWNDYFARK